MTGLFALLRFLLAVLFGLLAYRFLRRWLAKSGRLSAPERKTGEAARLEQCVICKDYLPAGAGNCGKIGCPRAGGGSMASFILLALCCCFSLPAAADGGGRYLAELSGSNIEVKLRVNGILTDRWVLPEASTAGATLNHWLRPGNNSIRIEAAAIQSSRAASLRLRVFFLSVATGRQTTLLELDDLSKLPSGGQLAFNLPSAPRLALWQPLGVAQLPPEQALTLIEEIIAEGRQLLADGANWGDLPAFANERADLARAFGVTATTHPLAQSGQSRQDKIEIGRQPTASDLLIEPVVATALVRVARRDALPLLAARSGKAVSTVQALIVGQVDGRWQVLRRSY
jgi:hypothetical protein